MHQTRIFISCASRDHRWRDRLRDHLNVLAGQSTIDIWDESQITPGDAWRETLKRKLGEAQIAILLISTNLLTSEIFLTEQVPSILQRHEEKRLALYPLLLKECSWELVPWLARLSIRPLDRRPVASLKSRADEVLAKVVQDIAALVQLQAVTQRLEGRLDEQQTRLESISKQVDRYRLKEAKARAEISLNCEMAVSRIPTSSGVAVETRVSVKNNGRHTVCIPAAYISARALAPTSGQAIFNFTQMDPLPLTFGSLAKTVNAAWIPDSLSMFQIAPDEVETLFRWDLVEVEGDQAPSVIVLNAEVCAASAELLGIHYAEQGETGGFREDWLSYMASSGGNEHNLFSRATREQLKAFSPHPIKTGDRILLKVGSSEPDIEATQRFHRLLKTVAQWSCNQVLVWGDARTASPTQPGSAADGPWPRRRLPP